MVYSNTPSSLPPTEDAVREGVGVLSNENSPSAVGKANFATAQDGNDGDDKEDADDDDSYNFTGAVSPNSLSMAGPSRSSYSAITVTKPPLGVPEESADERLVEKRNIASVTVDTKIFGDHRCDSATHKEGEIIQADEAPCSGICGQPISPDETTDSSKWRRHEDYPILDESIGSPMPIIILGTANRPREPRNYYIRRVTMSTNEGASEQSTIEKHAEQKNFAGLTAQLSLHPPFYASPALPPNKPTITTVEIEQTIGRKLYLGEIHAHEHAASLDAKLGDENTAELFSHGTAGAKLIDTFDRNTPAESEDCTSTIAVIATTAKDNPDKYALEHSLQPHFLAEQVGVNEHISISTLTLMQLEPQRADPIGINTSCGAGITESTRDELDIDRFIATAEALLRGEHVDILDDYRCDLSCAEIIERAEAYLRELEADEAIQGLTYSMIVNDSHTAQVARPSTTDAPVVEVNAESAALLLKAQEQHGDSFSYGPSTSYTENRLQTDSVEKPTAAIVHLAIHTVDTQGTSQSYNLETGGILLRNNFAPTTNAVREGLGVLPNEPTSAADAGNTDIKPRSPGDFTEASNNAGDPNMANLVHQRLVVGTDAHTKMVRAKDTADNPAKPGDYYALDVDADNVCAHENQHHESFYTHAAMTEYLDDKPDPRIIDALGWGPPAIAKPANSKAATNIMTKGSWNSIMRTN
jgi:hypothetical protein